MKKRLFSFLLALTMLLSAVPAFAEDPVNIEYWFGIGGKQGDMILSLIDQYNASQDKVHVTGIQFADYGTANDNYRSALVAGTEPACFHTGIQFIPALVDYLEPLNDRYANDPDFHAEDLLEGCLDCMYAPDGETIVGVPLYASTQVMYYRKDAFEGYDIEEVFSSWQNLYQAMKEITRKDDGGSTVFYGWEPMWNTDNWVDAVQSAGGTFFTDKESRHVNFLSQEWIDVMTFFSEAFQEGTMMMNHGGTGWEYWYKNIDDVLQGRAAGYTGSVGDMGDLDFSVVGCHRQPGFGGHEALTGSDTHAMAISKGASEEEKDAAWDFLKYMNSDYAQGQYSMASGYVITRKTVLNDPEFAAYVEKNPQILAAIEALDHSVKNYVDFTGGYVNTAYHDMVDRVLLEGMDVIESLTILQEEAQTALDEYWATAE